MRPAVPKFEGHALLKGGCTEDHLHFMSIYFRPWVLDKSYCDQSGLVQHITDLKKIHQTWTQSWDEWIGVSNDVSKDVPKSGSKGGWVLSNRSKRFIHNFQCVYSARAEDPAEEPGPIARDMPVELSDADAKNALHTDTRRFRNNAPGEEDASFQLVSELCPTMESNMVVTEKHPNVQFCVPHDATAALHAARESVKNDTTKQQVPEGDVDGDNSDTLSMSMLPSAQPLVKKWYNTWKLEAKVFMLMQYGIVLTTDVIRMNSRGTFYDLLLNE